MQGVRDVYALLSSEDRPIKKHVASSSLVSTEKKTICSRPAPVSRPFVLRPATIESAMLLLCCSGLFHTHGLDVIIVAQV